MTNSPNRQQSLPLAGTSKQSVDAIALFDGWLETQRPPFKRSTKRIYQFLWNRFIEWTREHKRHFSQLNEEDIISFLEGLEDTNRQQRERYQLIIYRAYTELQTHDPSSSNPALPSAINDIQATSWRDSSANQAKQFLLPQQSQALIESLQAESIILNENSQSLAWPTLWKRRRNACVVALLLGCGLKALEILSLKAESIYQYDDDPTYQLDTGKFVGFSLEEQVALNRTSPTSSTIHAYIHDYNGMHRQLTVPAWATESVRLWLLSLESEAPASSGLLFPANRAISPERPKQSMNPATLSRVVNGWGKLHGFTHLSAQKLRNSYGARCIESGASIADLDAQMGFVASAAGAFRLTAEWQQFLLFHEAIKTAKT